MEDFFEVLLGHTRIKNAAVCIALHIFFTILASEIGVDAIRVKTNDVMSQQEHIIVCDEQTDSSKKKTSKTEGRSFFWPLGYTTFFPDF